MSLLSEKEISKNCFLSTSFNKGKKLFQNDDVNRVSIRKTGKNTIILNGNINGNTKNSYNTSVSFAFNETKNGNKKAKYTECSCECEAFKTYKGFCKHIVATILMANNMFSDSEIKEVLEYCAVGYQIEYDEENLYGTDDDYDNDDMKEPEYETLTDHLNQLFDMYEDNRSFMYNPLLNTLELGNENFENNWLPYGDMPEYDVGRNRPGVQKSSSSLLDVMSGIVLKERNRFCSESTKGNVNLEPFLNLDYNDKPRLEFKIGITQMYVIKSIPSLLYNIKNQSNVRYGKNLEFVHNQSAFTKESIPFISMILDSGVKSNDILYANAEERRFLQLTPAMVDTLMENYEGKEIKTSGDIKYEYESMTIIRENPRLKVYIDGVAATKRAIINFEPIRLMEGVTKLYIVSEDKIYICSEEYCDNMREIVKLMKMKQSYYGRYFYGNSKNYADVGNMNSYEIVESDYAYFCSTLLPVFEKYMDVEMNNVNFEEYQAEEGKYEVYFETMEGGNIISSAKAIYGEKEHNLISVATVNETYRDIKTEYELRTLIEFYFPQKLEGGKKYLLKNDDEKLAELVEYGIEQIKEIADVFVSEDFKKIKIADNVKVKTGLSIKGNLLNVSWNVEGMSNSELYDILGAYSRKKKYYRLKTGELLNLKESGLDVLADINENLRLNKAQLVEGMADVPIYRSLYMDILVKENRQRIDAEKNEQFEKFVENFDISKSKQYELPKEITADLRGYQIEGYRWACSLAEFGFGGILADDMGLGKTLQMISYICSCKGKTHIVICPASLVYNWEAELHKFAPDLSVIVITGNARQRMELISECEKYDVVVTSYDLLKRDVEFYSEKEFGCEIIDEAQYIKNPATQGAKAVKSVKSSNRFALTGTPIENRLSELWSIFEFLMPGYLYSYKHFKEAFEEKIMLAHESGKNKDNTDSTGQNEYVLEKEEALLRLHKMINPFILRRLKKDVLQELPDKVEKVVYVKFDSEQENLYKATEKNIVMNIGKKSGREFKESKLQILAEITKLRQICCDPSLLYSDYKGECAKLDTCTELIESAIDGGHKILLFSQFSTMLGILESRLQKCGIKTFMLTGNTTKVSRKHMVERFQNGEADVFLISLKAGGTGLNLTKADMVIHYDPWWNVAAQNQATDRAHRIGQENKVTVIKLIAKNTIEERILKLQEMKKELADKIMSGENVSMASLTKEELMELFS